MPLVPGVVFWHHETAIGQHRWIVLSNATPEDKVLVVVVTTYTHKSHQETTCVLGSTDYSELDHDSWIRYDRARLFDVDFVNRQTMYKSLQADALTKVLLGARDSVRIEMGHQQVLMDQGLI